VAAERTRTPTEKIVARIWAAELRLPYIGLDEDFIDLGSHSLQGVAVVAQLEQRFGVVIPVRVLFEEPTVADLAAWIDRHRRETDGTRGEIIRFGAWIERQRAETGGTQAEIICLQEGGGLRPIFAVPEGRAAARALYGLAKLARETDLHRPFYAFPGDPPVPSDTPEESWVQAAAASLNDAVRTRQRNGPYLLLGSCVGGIIAWEMARQLEASGEIVHLFLVDTKHPSARPDAAARSRTEKRMRRSVRKITNPRLERTKAYRPEPLVGRVRLLANTDWHRDHPTLGWDARSIDCRDVMVMPKEHGIWLNFTAVAGWLRTGINVVDPQPQSSTPVERRPPPSDNAVHSAMAAEMVPSGAASTPATIVDAMTSWAERTPDAAALVGPEGDLFTYRRLAVEVDRLAGVLRRIGVGRDDPILIVLPNGPALATMILASMTAGIAAPLAWDMTRHEYIAAMSNDAGRIVVLPASQE